MLKASGDPGFDTQQVGMLIGVTGGPNNQSVFQRPGFLQTNHTVPEEPPVNK